MDQPRRARRRPGRDVVLLDERRAHPARDRVEQRARPDDPAADDDDVPGLAGERREVAARRAERWSAGRRCRDRRFDHDSGGPAGRRAMRHRSHAVPTIRTMIASGVWKTTSWSVGRQDAGQDGRAEDDRDRERRPPAGPRASPVAGRPGAAQPRSASVGMPIGATRTLPAWAAPRRVSRPVLGRWKVTVRSAEHGRVGRLAARQVDRRRGVDGDDRDAGRAGAPDDLDGRADRLAQGAADAGAEQRVDDDRRLVDAEAEHRDVTGDRRAGPW